MTSLYLFSFLQFALFHGPVIVVFYISNGLNLQDVYTLQTIHLLSKLITEIPAGLISDRIRRKTMLFVGTLLPAIAYFGVAHSETFLAFAFFEIVAGVGRAFVSGSDSAFAFEYLEKADQKHRYTAVEANMIAIMNVAFIMYAVVGGVLASVDIRLTFLASATFIGAGSVVALFLKEPGRNKTSKLNLKESWKMSVVEIQVKPLLAYWVVFGALFLFLREINFYTEQPILSKVGIDIKYFGLFPAVGAALWALSSWAMARRPLRTDFLFSFVAVFLFLVPSIIISVMPIGYATLFVYAFFYLSYGVAEPLVRAATNTVISNDGIRATILSVQSSLGLLIYCLVAPAFGRQMDMHSLQWCFGLMAFPAVLLLLLTFFSRRRSRAEVGAMGQL